LLLYLNLIAEENDGSIKIGTVENDGTIKTGDGSATVSGDGSI
jgi:hypothetical protein